MQQLFDETVMLNDLLESSVERAIELLKEWRTKNLKDLKLYEYSLEHMSE